MGNEAQVNHAGVQLVEVNHQRAILQLAHVASRNRRKAAARLNHSGLDVAHVLLHDERQLGATSARKVTRLTQIQVVEQQLTFVAAPRIITH